MDHEGLPLISTQTVYKSSRLVNILAINSRVYYVYGDSLSVSGCEIWRSKSKIVASCICGESIALVTESGFLTIVSLERFEGTNSPYICTERIGLTSHELVRRQVCATNLGRFVAVNVSKASVLIYEFDGSGLNFIRTVNASDGGYFQLTGDDKPYLWHLYKSPDCYTIEIFEAGPFSPISYPDVPVARLPIVAPQERPNLRTYSHVFIHSCETESLDGILVYIHSAVMYLSLRSAIIGDVIQGVIWLPSDWHPSISTAKVGTESKIYLCHLHNGKIVRLKSTKNGSGSEPVLSEAVGTLHYEMRLQGRCHIAVVDAPRETPRRSDIEESGSDEIDSDNSSKVVSEPPGSGRIRQFAIDSRKRPWRILTLGDGSLEARAPAIPVKVMANNFDANNVSRVVYVRELSLLSVSAADGGPLRCFIGGANRSDGNSEPHWRTKRLENLSIPFTDLICADVIGNHTLVLVGPQGVQLRSAFSPFTELAYIMPASSPTIVDAQFGKHFCIVRSLDSVSLISLEPEFPVSTLIEDLPVSFIRLQNSELHVGVDITMCEDQQKLESLKDVSRIAATKFSEKGGEALPRSKTGAILHFEQRANSFVLSGLSLHDHIPTMYHRSASTKTDLVVYGTEGLVGRWHHGGSTTVLTNMHSPLQWAGVISDDTFLLIGLGIFVISPHGCEELIEASGKSRDSVISSAAVLNDDVIAYITNGELKFLAGHNFGGLHSPMTLKSKLAPVLPKRVELHLLFVPSQRMLILHGENICMFYDSITFEQILVSGIAAAWCDTMEIWRFISRGEVFEHLLITNGRGLVESYSFSRDGPTLQCSCKYRAVVTQQASAQRYKEVLHCRDNAIYLGRNNEVIMAIPLPQHVTYRQTLKHQVRHISNAGDFLVVTTSKQVHILHCDKLEQIASVSLPDQVSEQLLRSKFDDDGVDVESEKPQDTEILKHVSIQIKSVNQATTSIFILCVVHSSSLKRYQGVIAEFETSSRNIFFWDNKTKAKELFQVMDIEPDPLQNQDLVHSRLRAYAVTSDYRVILVNVAPPENELPLQELF